MSDESDIHLLASHAVLPMLPETVLSNEDRLDPIRVTGDIDFQWEFDTKARWMITLAKQKVALPEEFDDWSETLKITLLSAPVPAATIASNDESDIHKLWAHRVPDTAMAGE